MSTTTTVTEIDLSQIPVADIINELGERMRALIGDSNTEDGLRVHAEELLSACDRASTQDPNEATQTVHAAAASFRTTTLT